MNKPKKLIEVALPLEDINREAAREKSIRHGHPSTLHLWWARRPLAACRAVIFAQMVDDPGSRPDLFPTEGEQEKERERLFKLIRQLVKWENINDKDLLEAARAEIRKYAPDGEPPPLFDPFAGGGSIPLEAQRLGLKALAGDLNPVAVLINKALIEIPPRVAGRPPVNPESRRDGKSRRGAKSRRDACAPLHACTPLHACAPLLGDLKEWKGAAGLAEDVRYYGKWMREEAERRIGHLYPKYKITEELLEKRPDLKMQGLKPGDELVVIAWLWARTVTCPNPACGVRMPLVTSFWLSKKKGKEAWVEPIVDRSTTPPSIHFEVRTGGKPPEPPKIGRGAKFRCVACGQIAEDQHIKNEGVAGRMGAQLMAIVAEGPRGRLYLPPTPEHEKIAQTIEPSWRPREPLAPDKRAIWCPLYGLDTFDKLFTNRQLVALTTFSDLVAEAREKVREDALAAYRNFGSAGVSPASKKSRPEACAPIKLGWRTRGYLPHFEAGSHPQMITFRLKDSLPEGVLQALDKDLENLPEKEQTRVKTERIEEALDQGLGECLLKDPRVASIVEEALRYFAGERYELHAWCIMPNHVHVLITPREGCSLSQIIHSWKSFTAHEINRLLGRKGKVWQEEYFDRYIRDEEHFWQAVQYIENNPVKAGLCSSPEEWPFNSAAWIKREATAYADAVATYLGLIINKIADRMSSICSWDSSRDNIRNTFARQALPMVWDFAEANPFSSSTGNFLGAVEWVVEVIERIPAEVGGLAQQIDATLFKNDSFRMVVSVDPPYYDNIGYADLSDFFYIWLRRSLKEIYPELFGTLLTPKSDELVATPYRFGGNREKARRFFEEGLRRAFENLRRVAHPDYPVTIYYAFKQAETDGNGESVSTGWETMLESLIFAGFQITGTWPLRTELGNRTVAMGTNALASSIVLVCRPRPEDAPVTTRRDFLKELKRELPKALKELQKGNIAPVDLAQAAIGPGMAIFSHYRRVLEADGSPMTVRTALALINQALDEYFAEQEAEYDPDTRWAVAWFEQYGFSEGPYGDAETLSKAKNTSVSGLEEAGILVARAGKVRLLKREELPEDWDPQSDRRLTVWEVTQHLIRTLKEKGELAAAEILARVGGLSEAARELAYRLYSICERKGWAKEAQDYNALIISWPELEKQVEELRNKGQQQELL